MPLPNIAPPGDHNETVVVAFRPNGREVALGAGKKVSLHSIEGGAARALPDHGAPVVAITFSQRGDALATVEEGGKVRVFHPSTAKLIAELPDAIGREVYAIVFSPDSKLVAGAGENATIWDVAKKKKLCVTEGGFAANIAFTPDQGSLVTTAAGVSARWDIATCTRKAEGGHNTGGTFGSWVSPGAKYIAASAPAGHGLAIYDGRNFKAIEALAASAGCNDHVGPVAFSRDGEIALASGSLRWFRSFRMASLKTIAAYDIPKPEEVTQLVMFDDGERLLVVRGDKKGELVSAVSKSVAYTIDFSGVTAFDLAWDMKRLLGATKTEAKIWDTATGKLLVSIPLPR